MPGATFVGRLAPLAIDGAGVSLWSLDAEILRGDVVHLSTSLPLNSDLERNSMARVANVEDADARVLHFSALVPFEISVGRYKLATLVNTAVRDFVGGPVLAKEVAAVSTRCSGLQLEATVCLDNGDTVVIT